MMVVFTAVLALQVATTVISGVDTPPASSAARLESVSSAIKPYARPEYLAIKHRLTRGWGTWNSSNVLAHVLLPEGFSLNLAFKRPKRDGSEQLGPAFLGRVDRDDSIDWIRPGLHAADGSYSELELRWRDVHVRVQSATVGDEVVLLISRLDEPVLPVKMIVSSAMLWNKSGLLSREADALVARLQSRTVRTYVTGQMVADPYVHAETPYLVVTLDQFIGVSTGRSLDVDRIRQIVDAGRESLRRRATAHGPLAEVYEAVEAGVAWNTIYEPMHDRVVSTVSRRWNEGFGGFVMFGWDNFFLSYASALISKDLAYANFAEHMRNMTEDGFVPNLARAGGVKSWDRSQPPVGALVLRELHKRYGDRWLLEASFDDLLAWNRWWTRRRANGQLLSYGSDVDTHSLRDPYAHSARTAGYESGMDDSPMYTGVPFNATRSTLELQDVGLSSLYIADSHALAEIADVIGRAEDAIELRARASRFTAALETAWDPVAGLYLNRRTDSGELSRRLSPTMFYPLLACVPTDHRAAGMVDKYLRNPAEFGGEHVLPSIARSDPAFPKQKYWKGAVWPPLNFLVYLGLRNYELPEARRELATKSAMLFLREWKRKGLVSENYSAITGKGDDPLLSSDSFYSWGTLMAMPSFIESGAMPAAEDALPGPPVSTSRVSPSAGLEQSLRCL